MVKNMMEYCYLKSIDDHSILETKIIRTYGEITYLFLNLNISTVEVWEYISDFIPHFIMDVVTYPWWD